MSTNKPDCREARHLLSMTMADLYEDYFAQARNAAAERLLQTFGEIAPSPGPGGVAYTGKLRETDRGPLRVLMFTGKISILIGYYPALDRFVFYQEGPRLKELGHVTIPFSPLAGVFYTKEPDTFVAPTPGEPLPMRSPLAVLMEKAISLAQGELRRQEERLLR